MIANPTGRERTAGTKQKFLCGAVRYNCFYRYENFEASSHRHHPDNPLKPKTELSVEVGPRTDRQNYGLKQVTERDRACFKRSMHSAMSERHTMNSLSLRHMLALRFKRHERTRFATRACLPSNSYRIRGPTHPYVYENTMRRGPDGVGADVRSTNSHGRTLDPCGDHLRVKHGFH